VKAEKYGTMAEQARFKNGYKQPSMVEKTHFNRCRNCAMGKVRHNGRWFCKLISYATAPGGWCLKHQPATNDQPAH